MKRARCQCQHLRRRSHRTGAVFAYALAYMTLTILLLGLTGTMLHVLLRSAETDQRMFRDLACLQEAERTLRDDAGQAIQLEIGADKVVMAVDGGTVRWEIEGSQIRRELTRDGQRMAVEQIRFRTGTRLAFAEQSASLFVLQVTAPAPTLQETGSKQETPSTVPTQTLEVMLPRPEPVAEL